MKYIYSLLGFIVLATILAICIKNAKAKEAFASTSNYPVVGEFTRVTTKLLTVNMELANTAKEIERGLMHRSSLPANTGMLFQFPDEQERAFWMRNTLVPLDMLFVTSAGRITNIHPSVPPHSEELRRSNGPAQYVVELPGGTAEKYGIQAGDRFQWHLV
jgi:uncharacterized membrane protein (UPF0127 family)